MLRAFLEDISTGTRLPGIVDCSGSIEVHPFTRNPLPAEPKASAFRIAADAAHG